jgi:hypothetical protein
VSWHKRQGKLRWRRARRHSRLEHRPGGFTVRTIGHSPRKHEAIQRRLAAWTFEVGPGKTYVHPGVYRLLEEHFNMRSGQ